MLRGPSFFVLAALSAARVASAQEPTVVLSAYTPPPALSVLTSGTASDSTSLPPNAASLPLRLTLLSTIYPSGPAFNGAGCGDDAIEAGGSIFPMQPYMQIQITPRLVLHGFSDLGCPGDPYAAIDAGIGGGFTYQVPLRPTLWLVASGGAFGIPSHGESGSAPCSPPSPCGIPARSAVYGGLDLATKTKDGRVFSTGLGVSTPGRGVRIMPRFTGSF